MKLNNIEKTIFELVDIEEIEYGSMENMYDISVEEDASFCLSDGTIVHNSAKSSFLSVRNPENQGAYPLRGKVMNVWEKTPKEILNNKEFFELVAILGLDLNDPNSWKNMNYHSVSFMTDADPDGQHISFLLMGFFYKFWPDMYKEGRIKDLQSPIMISTDGKKTVWSYSFAEAKENKDKYEKWYHRYIKGLASLTEEEYGVILGEPRFNTIKPEGTEWFETILGNDAEKRKDWLSE